MTKISNKTTIYKENYVSLFPNIKVIINPENLPLMQILDYIKLGKYKAEIEKLRKLKTKKTYSEAKKSLPYFTPSGTFTKRNNKGMDITNGFVVLDIDRIESETATNELKQKIVKGCSFAYAVFISPSGRGLKVIAKTNQYAFATDKTHKAHFASIEKYFLENLSIVLDKGNDISRPCFVSFDPELYINENATAYELPAVAPPAPEVKKKAVRDPQKKSAIKAKTKTKAQAPAAPQIEKITDGYLIFDRCIKALDNKGLSFTDGNRHAFSFELGCICNRYGLDERFTLGLFVHQFGSLTDDKAHHEKNIKDAYRKNLGEYFTHFFEAPAAPQKLPGNKKKSLSSKGNNQDKKTEDKPTGKANNDKEINEPKYYELYDFGVKDGFYYRKEQTKGGKIRETRVSNFTLEMLYHLKNENEPNRSKRILKISHSEMLEENPETAIVEIQTPDLVSVAAAKSIFKSQGNFNFSGSGNDLSMITEYLGRFEIQAEQINVLGLQVETNVYAFSNGVAYKDKFLEPNELGIIKGEKKNFYLPTANTINKKNQNFADYQNHKYDVSDVSFDVWINLVKTVYGTNGEIHFCFLAACLFRDLIFKECLFFPHLFLYGKSGAGKSKQAETFMSLFGKNIKPLSIAGASTPKAFLATLSQFVNSMVYFEEYKNTVRIDKIEVLKDTYNGYGYKRRAMDNSNTTLSTPVLSGCMIAGQDLPTKDIALLKRCMLLDFFETDRTAEAKTNYDKLKAIERENGLTQMLIAILNTREHFEKTFPSNFHLAANALKKYYLTSDMVIEDRLIENYAVILGTLKTLETVLKLPFTYDSLFKVVLRKIKAQNDTINNSDELAKFWKIVYNLMTDGIQIDKSDDDKEFEDLTNGVVMSSDSGMRKDHSLRIETHYKKFMFKDREVLGIRFGAVHDTYGKEHQKIYHLDGADQTTLLEYLKNDSAFVSNDGKGKNDRHRKYVRFKNLDNATGVYMFDYKQLAVKYFDMEL